VTGEHPLAGVRSALFLPASNPRALAKARTLPCDLVILDLEDAVAPERKAEARAAARSALDVDWGGRLVAVRANGLDGPDGQADLAALSGADGLHALVLPKVEAPPPRLPWPVLAMIETPAGLYAAREIAGAPGVAGLIAGVNDLAVALHLPPDAERTELALPLQMILLAARAAGGVAWDGVWNRLDDASGFEADAAAAVRAGFDGKTLIHPSQVEPCNRLFAPTAAQVAGARALLAAAGEGARRFEGRMVEAMHVAAARRLLARAGGAPG
jgi:citrate lyase subunit beta/citryl-CoA lyase